jgi:hypothetical protein
LVDISLRISGTTGNFFSMNCDAVDYSMAHIPSYLVAGLND